MKLNKEEAESLRQSVKANIARLNNLSEKNEDAKEVRLLMSEAREQLNLLLTAKTEEEEKEEETDMINSAMLFQLFTTKKKIDKEFVQILFNRFSSDDLRMVLGEIEKILRGRREEE